MRGFDEMKILISCGGTAGHINPGIAIANKLKSIVKEVDILFVGTEKGMENTLVPKEGYELKTIKARGLKRKISFDLFKAAFDAISGYNEARTIIKQFKPDVVVGTGGYACFPVVLAACMMRIPSLIHEQNAFPGLANRILSRFADVVAISFDESRQYFNRAKKIEFTGNPVREEIFAIDKKTARQRLNIPQNNKVVVVTGGSLGAKKINDTVMSMIRNNYNGEFEIIFSTGKRYYDEIINSLEGREIKGVKIVPYIYNAAEVYNAADIMVCRAGAITCSELAAAGIPSILIPSPNVTANHQEHNARALEKKGAAYVILEKELSPNILYDRLISMLSDQSKLNAMSRHAFAAGTRDAAIKLAQTIMRLIK